MAQPASRVPLKEINNHPQGRRGSKVKTVSGPAVGHASGNPTKRGGIMQPTRGKRK